jgi:hypothetical protein
VLIFGLFYKQDGGALKNATTFKKITALISVAFAFLAPLGFFPSSRFL